MLGQIRANRHKGQVLDGGLRQQHPVEWILMRGRWGDLGHGAATAGDDGLFPPLDCPDELGQPVFRHSRAVFHG